ncbi:MAG: pyridoxal-phosphate dependent enzyme [Bacteroidetes bacterium]|nr:pyridoxal-phosphate dependent enzyme [Bacteroidota bacterium]MBS1758218.1 pyridoxal-phosphate dependent enzyme [Bacteroidota bacterium]
MLFYPENIEINHIDTANTSIKLLVARLDKIHPIVSGNKLFKLHYFLQDALQSTHKTILTFGGAYSNHLVATAFACKAYQLNCIGIVRGEKPQALSATLQQCIKLGMQLHFISREEYKNNEAESFTTDLKNKFGHFILIPEGGFSTQGAAGAAKIMDLLHHCNATHIATATGTATTLAGLLMAANNKQQIISIPVIKNMTDIESRIKILTGKNQFNNLKILGDYHFGGYAKKNTELINFINSFYKKYTIPTDFVYTAKMMFGIMDQISKNYFPAESTIVCLHTGGLQGNHSLPSGTLIF